MGAIKICRACGEEHDPRIRCDQAKRLRDIRPSEAGRLPEETAVRVVGDVRVPEVPGEMPAKKVRKSVPSGAVVVSKTANRRTREAYNAYMREYMRKHPRKKVPV